MGKGKKIRKDQVTKHKKPKKEKPTTTKPQKK